MSEFSEKLKDAYANAYKNAYAMKNKGLYTKPQIYDAGGDTSKRWYVYFSYLNPKTNKMERQTPLYYGMNRLQDATERRVAAKQLRDMVENVLKNGYSPYEEGYTEEKVITIEKALELGLENAQATMKETSFKDYKYRLLNFQKWLYENGFKGRVFSVITKRTVLNFLNSVLQRTSPKNRNNFRASLSILFTFLEENEYITDNFVSKIPVLKAKPERNKTYTQAQEEELFKYLETHDKQLLLMIKFVSYNFLRPIEVCRLRVKDINFEERQLVVDAKNQLQKTKIIPELLFKEIAHIKGANPDYYLFAPQGVGSWDTTEMNKRDYWSKRFKKVKEVFGMGSEYGIYSFRHTFITKLYRELRKTLTPYETKSQLMLITGHTTFTALDKYLRDIDAELPADYSALILQASR